MKQNKRKTIIVPLIVFFLAFGMLTSMFLLIENRSYYQKREQYLYLAANQSSIIEGCLDTVIARTYTLSAMIEENEGGTAFFDLVSKRVYDEVEQDTGVQLKNIAIAPDGVVEKVYPYQGNEQLVGFDFMDTSQAGNQEAVEAYNKGDIVITAPFELKQGGTGIGARLPVIINTDDGNQLWGLVTVTFDYDNLMDFFKLSSLKNLGADYRLWYTQVDGSEVVLQQSENKPVNPVSYDVTVKNLTWHLEVSPQDGWTNVKEIIFGIMVILFVSASLAYFVFTREHIKNANKEIMTANQKLEYLATRDALTSCYSRHYVNSTLLKLPEGTWNDPSVQYSLAIVDIDYFKQINDNYGHDIGDQAILAVAGALKNACDENRGDCVIRFGGDEFIVLVNHVNRQMFESILEKMISNVRSISLENCREAHLSISVGAVLADENTNKYYDLLKDADGKLYHSKENGKNQYTL